MVRACGCYQGAGAYVVELVMEINPLSLMISGIKAISHKLIRSALLCSACSYVYFVIR
jgi:hypothetical protein